MKNAATSLRRSPGTGPVKKDPLFKLKDIVVAVGLLAVAFAGVYGMSV